jgi:predicted  nucleic acid-binding Zn-ribbon protein
MAETDSIVHEHLRHIRGSVDVLRDDMREVKQRVGALGTEVAQVNVRLAEVSNRIDRLANRVERIEVRLNLAAA